MIVTLKGGPVAVFDLDGCLCQGPYHDPRSKEHLDDPEFWRRHWDRPDAPCHTELVEMARGLASGGFHILVLTARPDTYHDQTVRWLQQVGNWSVASFNTSIRYNRAGSQSDVWLMMIDNQRQLRHPLTGAEWKRETVRSLIQWGIDIQFVVEDYKPNADVIREVVPVLLYERQKPHPCVNGCQHSKDVAMYPEHTCGGNCWYDVHGHPPGI